MRIENTSGTDSAANTAAEDVAMEPASGVARVASQRAGWATSLSQPPRRAAKEQSARLGEADHAGRQNWPVIRPGAAGDDKNLPQKTVQKTRQKTVFV